MLTYFLKVKNSWLPQYFFLHCAFSSAEWEMEQWIGVSCSFLAHILKLERIYLTHSSWISILFFSYNVSFSVCIKKKSYKSSKFFRNRAIQLGASGPSNVIYHVNIPNLLTNHVCFVYAVSEAVIALHVWTNKSIIQFL